MFMEISEKNSELLIDVRSTLKFDNYRLPYTSYYHKQDTTLCDSGIDKVG